MSVGKFERLRELTMESLVDGAMIFRKRRTRHKPGDKAAISRVPPAGRLIGFRHEWVRQGGPFNRIVDQNFKPEDTTDPRVTQRVIKGVYSQIGRQQLQQWASGRRGHRWPFYTAGPVKMPTRTADEKYGVTSTGEKWWAQANG